MALRSRAYWRDREEAQRQKNITDEAEYRKEVERIYRHMMSEMSKEISDFYVKYASKEGISLAEAKRRVKRVDMKAYSERAKEYAKNRDFSAQANAEMELYNLTMKANRLEMLKAELGMHVVGGFDEMQKYFDEKLSERALDEFQRMGGILGETVQGNGELINSIVNASFHNATFSDRIWGNYAGFKSSLERELIRGLIGGVGASQLSANIRKACADVSAKEAMRLMVTELARVRTDASKRSMEKNGNKKYEFMALGQRPCPICQGLNGKIFLVKDMEPGENAPPMHPWCHCAVAPHWDEWEDENGLEDKGDIQTDITNLSDDIVEKSLQIHNYLDRIGLTGSKWSGKTVVKTRDEMPRSFGRKKQNCDIWIREDASEKTIIHEHLHARSASRFPNRTKHVKPFEEGPCELLAEEICKRNGIPYRKTYSDLVSLLRNWRSKTGIYKNDYDFAIDLFNVPLPERQEWLYQQSDNSDGLINTIFTKQLVYKLERTRV